MTDLGQDMPYLIWEAPETLIQWYLALNAWQWPAAIPAPEPIPAPGISMATTRRWGIMQAIQARVGERAILRAHNHRMDDVTFEAFWRVYTGADREPTGAYADWCQARAQTLAQVWATPTRDVHA